MILTPMRSRFPGGGQWLAVATPVAAALMLLCQLLPPPVPGVADNGDFPKLIGRFGLRSGSEFVHAGSKLRFDQTARWESGFRSTELLLLAPAIEAGRAVSKDGALDVRVIGCAHTAVFVLAAWLAAPALGNAAVAALALLLFCDFMYAGFFHSFYVEPGAYLFVLLAAVFYVRAVRRPAAAESAGFLGCALLAVGASAHYAVLGPWFAALLWAARGVLCRGRKGPAVAAIALLITASWASFRYSAPQSYAPKNPFNVIFSQILPNSAHPDAALAELGLDGSYRRWNGAQAYTPGVRMDDPAFYKPFAERTGFGKIGWFYLRHPADAWKALAGSLDEAGRFQSPLGNFDSGSGKPPGAHYESFQWASGLKRRLFHHRGGPLFGACLALAAVTAGAFLANRRRLPNGAVSGAVALAGASVTMLVVSAMADVYDQFRHQLVTFAMFDMLVVALVWLLLRIYPDYRARVSRQ